MALDATTLGDLIDEKYADLNDDYANSPDRDAIKEGMFLAIAQAIVEHLQNEAEVSFVAGDFAGTDSNGDSPDNITASGGTIS